MVIILNVEIVLICFDSKVTAYSNKCRSCVHCLDTHVPIVYSTRAKF